MIAGSISQIFYDLEMDRKSQEKWSQIILESVHPAEQDGGILSNDTHTHTMLQGIAQRSQKGIYFKLGL